MISIRDLVVFQTVCEEGSFTEAARKLYMTQPAVSHVVQALEKETGTVLFDRLPRSSSLNATGRLFLDKTRLLLDLYEDLKNNSEILEESAEIKIGSCITIANFILPGILKQFRSLHPGTPVTVQVASAAETTELLLQNRLDMAFLEGPVCDRQLEAEAFSEYRLAFACTPDQAALVSPHGCTLSEPFALSPEDLLLAPLLLREKGSAIRDVLDSALLLYNIRLKPVWISVNSQALIQAALSGLGITALPEELLTPYFQSGSLVQLEVADLPLSNRNHLVRRTDKHMTHTMQDFAVLTLGKPL